VFDVVPGGKQIKKFDQQLQPFFRQDWRQLFPDGKPPYLDHIANQVQGFNSRHFMPGKTPKSKVRKAKRAFKKNKPKPKRVVKSAAKGKISAQGGVVQTVNAPVAFARKFQRVPGVSLGVTKDPNVIKVESVDYLGKVTCGAANTFAVQGLTVDPNVASLPWAQSIAKDYEKFKLLKLTIHYVHFSSTATVGKVLITWSADPDATTPAQSSDMVPMNSCVTGACYEDFGYTADPSQFQKDWLLMKSAAAEDDTTFCGKIFYATDNNPVATTDWGDIYIEAQWMMTGRKSPALSEVPATFLPAVHKAVKIVDAAERKRQLLLAIFLVEQFVAKRLEERRKAEEAKLLLLKEAEEESLEAIERWMPGLSIVCAQKPASQPPLKQRSLKGL